MHSRHSSPLLGEELIYDVEVTENEMRQCCIKSLTPNGLIFLRTLIPGYTNGKVVVLGIHPEEFLESAPDDMNFLLIETPLNTLH